MLGASTETFDNTDNDLIEASAAIVDGKTRKLFKLGSGMNVPRGASGRSPTAYGSLASAWHQYDSFDRAEAIARENASAKETRRVAKEIVETCEKPLMDLLISARYMNAGERLTKKELMRCLWTTANC